MTDKKKFSRGQNGFPKFNIFWVYIGIMLIFFGVSYFSNYNQPKEIDWNQFKTEMLQDGEVAKVIVINEKNVEVFLKSSALNTAEHKDVSGNKKGPQYTFSIGSVDYFQQQLEEAQADLEENEKVSPRFETRENWFSNIFSWLLPIIIIIAVWMFIMRRMSSKMGGGGGNPFSNTGKSKAKLFDGKEKVNVNFDQVAGLDEAKEEIMEVVDFLKNPERYKKLGANIPKGVLLTGPPGTGKTLMAKAMAGEADVPFFSISGSDFVEMFVGVGAARVRDLFKKGREKAPCIIFIDEIEAIGRSRGRSNTQTNDERENTLNQLLVEMDGFNTDKTVIILAATNRPDLLDNALLRPGRFDRQIQIDKPDIAGREQIFKVHLKKLTLGDDINAMKLAEQTPGFAGAEIANVCNEAALHAARKRKSVVEMEDFISAIDRVIGGLEKKNKLISPKEKKIIAYHETGHAVTGWFLEHAHPLLKVSIIPRGEAALGFAQYLPKEQYLYTSNELRDTICMTLGGRIMEEIIFKDVSSGAQNDLEKTTQIAYAMIALYGMNKEVGPFSFKDLQNEYSMRQPYSEETANMIDIEARKFINECYERTRKLLEEHLDQIHEIAKLLMEKEVLYKEHFVKILGERDFDGEEKS
jgi:cell division protease FtsH